MLTRNDWALSGGLALFALIIYGITLAPTVLPADSGEFQFVAWLPGIAHPTGYPLYTLLGWLWSHLLPFGEVAWRLNLFSAVMGAIGVGVFYLAARQVVTLALPHVSLASQRLSAAIATATLIVNPIFWSQAIIAEVYTLHGLFISLILWLVLQSRPPIVALAALFGLALAHHVTILLFIPSIVAYWWLTSHEKVEQSSNLTNAFNGRAALLALVLLITIPMILYSYLPVIAPHTPYATLPMSDSQTLTLYKHSWAGFWQHVSGSAFHADVQPTAVDGQRFVSAGRFLYQQISWGMGAAVIGCIVLLVTRFNLFILTGLSFVIIVGFNLVYFIGDIIVLFIPAGLILCLWMAVGMASIADYGANRFVRHRLTANTNLYFRGFEKRLGQQAYQLVILMLIVPWGIVPIMMGFTHIHEVSQADNRAAQTQWQSIFNQPLPEQAILLSNDRNEIMPMWYYQYVEGVRPDLLGLFPLIVADPDYQNIGRLLDQALQSERPVYLIKPMPGLEIKARFEPLGPLVKVEPYEEKAASPTVHHLFGERIRLSGYDIQTRTNRLSVTLHWQPTQPLERAYTSYVHLLDASGMPITQHDHQPGGEFYPTNLWQVGEHLRDHHDLTLPENLPHGPYDLRVGWYYFEGQIENLGQADIIGKVHLGTE